MKRLLGLLTGGLLLVALIGSANAVTISAVDGTWTGTTGGSNVNYQTVATSYGNLSEDQVRWGTGSSGQSGLGFTGVGTPYTFNINDVFEIGQLRHFNNPINAGTAASQAFLTISMNFSDPAGLNGAFDFTFAIDETSNAPGPPLSDDLITFPASYASETFEISGIDYTLQLLGFGDISTSLLDDFSSPEGGTNDTLLWGRITTPNPVPEPATMLLFGIGLLGLAGVNRRKHA